LIDYKPAFFQEIDRLFDRVNRQGVGSAIQFWTIGLIFAEHVVDGREEHSGNGNDSLFVAATLFDSLLISGCLSEGTTALAH